jgi:peptidoglycan/LPS O-acetylase OafA/YrhL
LDERADERAEGALKATRPAHYHFEFVDGIRAACALFVMIAHAWFQPSNGFYKERWMNVLGLSHAHLAVVVFIVVSGFVITFPITRRGDHMGSVLGFYKRRIRRIIPPYYAALVLSILFILATGQQKTGTVWDASVPLSWSQIFTHFGMVNNWPLPVRGGSIGYQLWSIPVEFQIYLLTPLLIWGLSKIGLPALTVVCIAVSALAVLFVPPLKSATIWFVVLFLYGSATGRIIVHHAGRANTAGLTGLFIVLGSLAMIAKGGNAWFEHNQAWVDMCVGLGTALLMAGIACGDVAPLRLLRRILCFKSLVWIGSFSYSLYLVHTALLHGAWLCWSSLLPAEPKLMFACLLVTSPVIVLLAYLFHLAFERPFMSAAGVKPQPAQSLVASPSR